MAAIFSGQSTGLTAHLLQDAPVFMADASNTLAILLGGRVLTESMADKLTRDAPFTRSITPEPDLRQMTMRRRVGPAQ